MDAEEADVERERALVEDEEVLQAAADVEPALKEARVAPLPERHHGADDDGHPERRDDDDMDVGASLAERRVRDAFDGDTEQEHQHQREQVAEPQREAQAVDGRRRLARRPQAEERAHRDQVSLREVGDPRCLHGDDEAKGRERDDRALGDAGPE